MTKSFLLAAALTLATAAALPAMAGEGNGEPFPSRASGVTTQVARLAPDVGSASYPNVYGRAGSNLAASAGDVTGLSNESPVQSANSEPRGFTLGTMAFVSQPSRLAALGQ